MCGKTSEGGEHKRLLAWTDRGALDAAGGHPQASGVPALHCQPITGWQRTRARFRLRLGCGDALPGGTTAGRWWLTIALHIERVGIRSSMFLAL